MCCVQAGAPRFKRDVNQMETVQRIMMRELKNITYEGRLKALRLFRVKRGLRGDAITLMQLCKRLLQRGRN